MSKSTLIASIVLFLLVVSCSFVMGANRAKVTVYLLDGSSVSGELLDVATDFVRINPEGAVSFRAIPTDQVDRVLMEATGKEYKYPLDAEGLDRDVTRVIEQARPKRQRPKEILSLWALGLSFARMSPVERYYETLDTGFAVRPEVQLRLGQNYPNDRAVFLSLAYGRGSLGIAVDSRCRYYPYGYCREITKARLERWTFSAGLTSRVTDNKSYVYAKAGISVLKHSITECVRQHCAETGGTVSIDSSTALHMAVGANIGTSSRYSIVMDAGLDLFSAGSQRSLWFESHGASDEMGVMIALGAGLMFSL